MLTKSTSDRRILTSEIQKHIILKGRIHEGHEFAVHAVIYWDQLYMRVGDLAILLGYALPTSITQRPEVDTTDKRQYLLCTWGCTQPSGFLSESALRSVFRHSPEVTALLNMLVAQARGKESTTQPQPKKTEPSKPTPVAWLEQLTTELNRLYKVEEEYRKLIAVVQQAHGCISEALA